MREWEARTVAVKILRLPHAPPELPAYCTPQAAGMDLAHAGDDLVLDPGQRALLPTGFCIAIPEGFEGQVRMRSGFALKTGVILPNGPGTVDADYRGELKILVLNAGREPVAIRRGDRIAQLVIAPVVRCCWDLVSELPPSDRGAGGFGSTDSGP